MPDIKTDKKQTWPVITCPHCGAQYAPAEIFMPGDLIGKPETVIRDALNKIIYQDFDEEDEPCSAEHYICDHCGKAFVVEPVVSYKVKKEDESLDFSEQSVSLLD